MKEILLKLLFIDERTNKFSTSKWMLTSTFYLIMFLNIKAIYLDREIKNTAFLTECFIITSSLYFSRKFSVKTKNIEVNNDRQDKVENEIK